MNTAYGVLPTAPQKKQKKNFIQAHLVSHSAGNNPPQRQERAAHAFQDIPSKAIG
jgi:hypothetical protein